MITLDLPRTTPRAYYRALHRAARIAAVMAQEVMTDTMIYGCGYQLRDDTGIYNLPPQEVVVDRQSGKAHWAR